MSVRRRKWRDPETGVSKERWVVDVDFKLPNGTRKRVREASPVDTRRGAEEYERQLRQALLDGSHGKEVKKVPTVAEFENEFMTFSSNNNKPSTILAKRLALKNHVLPAFGEVRLDQVDSASVETFKATKLEDGQSRKTINNLLCVFRKMMNLAQEYGHITAVPKMRQFPGRKLQDQEFEFLHFEELPRFLEKTPKDWLAFIHIALKTGLREGELFALKWADVDLVLGRLIVRATRWYGPHGHVTEDRPKGGANREVPLSDEAISVLKAHRHLRGQYVFCLADGSPLAPWHLKGLVPGICQRAGLAKRLTAHDLRHTFASHLVMRGASLVSVQQLLGHSTITMTMRYAHLAPNVKRDAVMLLDQLPTETPARHMDGT